MKVLSTSFVLVLLELTASAQTGIGTTTPRSTLDVNGAISVAETTSTALTGANPAYTVPANVSQVRLIASTTAPTGMIAMTTTSPVTGQQLAIYNNTTIPAILNSQTVPAGQVSSFVYSNSGWRASAVSANNTGWSLLGNAGTVSGTNFIGTTDNVTLNFRVNNLPAGRIGSDGSTFYGYQSGQVNTSNNNQFMGYNSGYSNTTGGNDQFSGYQSGYSNTTGGNNQFLGYQSGYTNTTGATNQFSGYQSGYSNTIGNTNQFSGFESGYSNTTASYGQFMGYQSGYSTTTGGNNQFLGYNSGHSNTVGGNNLFIGNQSGFSNTTGNNNFGIGYMAGPMTGALSNAGAIGYNAQVGTSNTLVLGGTGSDAVNVLIGYTNDSGSNYKLDVNGTIRATATLVVSDARLKQNVRPVTGGLASVLRLRGVRYDFRRAEFPAKNLPIGQQIGFIAQEMEKVYPELVTTDAQGFKGVNYAQLTPVLVQAMQEQQAEIMALKAANADLKATTAGLKASLDSKASASTLDEMRVALQALRGEIQILKASTSTASAK